MRPDDEIEPYDETLNKMNARMRHEWAQKVASQMRALPRGGRLVVFAGLNYREPLLSLLTNNFSSIEIPLEGLKIGEQLRWFNFAAQPVSQGSA